MKRTECTEIIIDTIREKSIKYQELADGIGRSLIWTTLALQGQATMDEVEATKISEVLVLGTDPDLWFNPEVCHQQEVR